MRNLSITIHHEIFVARPGPLVWDYTQNYDHRHEWDDAVLRAELVAPAPNRIVKLKLRGNTAMNFIYKLDERPHKTTLAAKEIKSPIIESAGGSWTYEEEAGGTRWTQTNTIVLKNKLFLLLFLPLFRILFDRQTKKAMQRAKEIMERS
jgi:hypothetical protein